MTNENEIKALLWQYGHFRNPAYPNTHQVSEADLASLHLSDPVVQEAVRSYQHLQKPTLDGLSVQVHGRRAVADGEVGPATEQLFDLPRCGAADYAMGAEKLGAGRWGQCKLDLYPEDHAVTVHWDLTRCPAHVKPHFETIWANVVAAYAEMGIALVRVLVKEEANLQCRFTVPQQEAGNLRGNWIGLAIVGWAGVRCTDNIWALFDLNYAGRNVVTEWTTLIKHEIGHNLGLQHSSGGVMNPSIINGLAISWKGDPSEPILARWYGGRPVKPPVGGPGDDPTPPGSGALPDMRLIYEGRPYIWFPDAPAPAGSGVIPDTKLVRQGRTYVPHPEAQV